jgi:phage repressor protein C with HTH and peptisase S24 domain
VGEKKQKTKKIQNILYIQKKSTIFAEKYCNTQSKKHTTMQDKPKKTSAVKERILYFVDTLSISKREFYRITGISRGTLESESGITEETLARFIATYTNISEKWLLTGEGEMFKKDETQFETLGIDRRRALPLLPVEAIAGWDGTTSPAVMNYDCEWIEIPQFVQSGADYIIRVSGDSMSPEYRSGDLLACRRIREITFFQWGKVYVIDSNQGIMLKRVEECVDDPDCILCVSENPRHRPFSLPKNEINSLSLVIGLVRSTEM